MELENAKNKMYVLKLEISKSSVVSLESEFDFALSNWCAYCWLVQRKLSPCAVFFERLWLFSIFPCDGASGMELSFHHQASDVNVVLDLDVRTSVTIDLNYFLFAFMLSVCALDKEE